MHYPIFKVKLVGTFLLSAYVSKPKTNPIIVRYKASTNFRLFTVTITYIISIIVVIPKSINQIVLLQNIDCI